MKSIFLFITITILCFINCSGGGEEIVALAKQEMNSQLTTGNINISLNANLSGASIQASNTAHPDLIGSWSTTDQLQNLQFQNDGQGFYIKDNEYNGYVYSYYKDFNWKHSGVFIYITYTAETTIRNGNQIIREKTISEQTTYKISGDNIIVDNISFHKK